MTYKRWTPAEEKQLRKLYPNTPTKTVAELLGCAINQVYSKACKLGLSKSAAYLAGPQACRLRRGDNVGKATRFQKGQRPWNTGLKGFQQRGRAKETQFRKGRTPQTWVPVGTEVMSSDGYLKIKVAEPNVWEWTHRRNWEAAHGPIPKGGILVFKVNDHYNCAVENLELIDRTELMRRNTIARFPPELRSTIMVARKLQRIIEDANEKQD